MRFWFSGPRIFGVRPGVSFSPDDLRRRASGPSGSFVYVIRGDHNLSKIGVSTNPDARMAQLRTASPFPLEFAYISAIEGDGYDVEQEAHRILGSRRVNGEWFDVPPEMAISAVTGAAARLGRRLSIGEDQPPPARPGLIKSLWTMIEWALLAGVFYFLWDGLRNK